MSGEKGTPGLPGLKGDRGEKGRLDLILIPLQTIVFE